MAYEPEQLRHYTYALAAMLESAADQDAEGIVDLEGLLRAALEEGIPQAVESARRKAGGDWSYAYFAQAAGISRQAAHKRYSLKTPIKRAWVSLFRDVAPRAGTAEARKVA